MTNAEKIAKLEREIAKLKAAQPDAPLDYEQLKREEAKYRDELHQSRERAANGFRFSPAIQRSMDEACGTVDLRGIAMKDNRAPLGPNYQGVIPSSQSLTSVHARGKGVAGDGTGWRDATPLGPQPGINHVDRIAEGFAQQDKAELAKRLKGG